MGEQEKIDYWIEIALDDLDSAEIMLKSGKYLQSGFYCHQAIEKVLKGYYLYNTGSEPPYTHNLLRLAEESYIADILSDEQGLLIDMLMPLNIEARYPDDRREIMKTLTSEKSRDLYNKTKGLFSWIQALMKK